MNAAPIAPPVRHRGAVAALTIAALAAAAVLVPRLAAVSTVFWHSAGYQEFSQGQLNGVSLSQDGQLTVAPSLEAVFHSDQELIWTMAADAGGDIFLATGHRGKIFRLTPAMLNRVAAGGAAITPEEALWFTAPEAEIFALAVGPDGALYAGSSPDGKVYRIDAAGKSSVYFNPGTHYIWSLAFAHNALFAGTGENGEIYRITAAGVGAKYLDTRQREVMALAVDRDGNLLAGTEPGGLVYRIQPDQKAFVLYHSDLPEIHALRVGPAGDIYVSAQGAGSPRRLPSAASGLRGGGVATANFSVTIQSDAQQTSPLPTPGGAPGVGGASIIATGPIEAPPVVEEETPAMPTGAVLSAIYRIAPSGAVDTLWSSRRENADGLLPSPRGLLFSTDAEGRIYELNPDRQATVLVQTQQEEATQLLQVGGAIYATTRDLGNLYRVGSRAGAEGTFLSPVKDTGSISQWGDVDWQGDLPAGSLTVYTRSGNSESPDFTWSDWSAPYTRRGQRVSSPPARYIQWKAVLHTAAGDSPSLSEIEIPYLPANQAPVISAVRVRQASGENGDNTPGGDGMQSAGGRGGQRGIQLSWSAQDPDGDALTYNVYFEGQGETAWKLLRSNLAQTQILIGSSMLPDGIYRFKVVASDGDDNPPALAKSDEMVSAPAALDTVPPTVTLDSADASQPGTGVAHFTAVDHGSALAKAEFAVDGGPWRELLADTGIVDGSELHFTVRGTGLAPGEHVLMLRVTDEAGNQGSSKAVVVTQ